MDRNPLKTLKTNVDGKDYVIGDLHGSFSVLENLLKNLNFDKNKDRLISVGDLVDRGPKSFECLQLLHEPWFHAVLANHEQMMLDAFENPYNSFMWLNNGGTWAIEKLNDYKNRHVKNRIISDESHELFQLLELTRQLPYLITVNTKSGKKFHIIHAELPKHVDITDEILADDVKVHRLANMQGGEGGAFLWSRNVFGAFYDSNLQNTDKILRTIQHRKNFLPFNDNLSHVISGHTVLQKPMTIWNQTCIDTCAHESYVRYIPGGYGQSYSGKIVPTGWEGLTCIELDSWKFYKATETTFTETTPLVFSRDDIFSELSVD